VDSVIRLPLHMMSRVERLLAELIASTIEPAPRLIKSVEEKKNDVGDCNPILQEAMKRNLLPFALERANARLAQLRWCDRAPSNLHSVIAASNLTSVVASSVQQLDYVWRVWELEQDKLRAFVQALGWPAAVAAQEGGGGRVEGCRGTRAIIERFEFGAGYCPDAAGLRISSALSLTLPGHPQGSLHLCMMFT
jgi:hypothetical protein